jgi:hypothetical protein
MTSSPAASKEYALSFLLIGQVSFDPCSALPFIVKYDLLFLCSIVISYSPRFCYKYKNQNQNQNGGD